jgi:hypothetical protein
MSPLAMLLINIGIVNGEVRDGPWSRGSSAILQRFQRRSATYDDTEAGISFYINPLSSRAIWPRQREANRSVRRHLRIFKECFRSKPVLAADLQS